MTSSGSQSTDPPTNPGVPRSALTPEATDQADQHIGSHGELVLPDVVPIVDLKLATPFGLWLNRWWIRTHMFLRGIAGTGAEWFIFFVGAASQYPRVSGILLAITVVFTEERFSEHPVMTNVMKYAMHSFDPDAADAIFAEKPVDNDPIGKAAKRAVDEATRTFLDSSDYRLLKEQIEQDVQRQTRRQAFAAAGMTEDVEAIDAEIAEIRRERRAERAQREAVNVPTAPALIVNINPPALPVEPESEPVPTEESLEEPLSGPPQTE